MCNRIEKELKRFLSSQEYKNAKCDSQKSIAEHFYALALKDVVSHSRLKTGSMPQGQRSRLISPSDKAQAFELR